MKKKISTLTIFALLGFAAVSGAAERKVIIGFKKGVTANEEQKRQRVYRSGGHLKRSHKLINAISARIPEEEIEALKKDPAVAYVEPDVTVGLTDPLISLIPSPEYDASWGVTRIGGADAAAAGFTGAGVKVAILDSGIDCSHPDLIENCRSGYNFAYDNYDTFDDAYNSHGTHLAGIIAARNNGTGVVGVAPAAELYPVKVFGGMVNGDLSDILAGMEWSILSGMNVINLSIGAPIDSPSFKDACDRAYQAGIVVVAAAGNNKSNSIDFPAAYDSVIAVSSTGDVDPITLDMIEDMDVFSNSFSSYGDKVELAAPGCNIKSTQRGGGYRLMSGTSQSTAHVTGAVAVLLSKRIADANGDGRNADDVRALLTASTTDLGVAGKDPYFGYGLVNLTKALTLPPNIPTTLKYTLTNKTPLKVPLKSGTYKVEIIDREMPLQIMVRDISGTKKIASLTCRKRTAADSTLLTTIGENGNLIFQPMGRSGSTALIRITPTQ